jgi:hypothetical protein
MQENTCCRVAPAPGQLYVHTAILLVAAQIGFRPGEAPKPKALKAKAEDRLKTEIKKRASADGSQQG